MPSCLTKSFAESRYPHASLEIPPGRLQAKKPPSQTARRKDRSALARLKNWAETWAQAPRKRLVRPPSNASRPDDRLPRNGSEIAILRVRPPIRLGARHAHNKSFRQCYAAVAAILLLLIGIGPAHARDDEAAQRFLLGRNSFEAQDYAGALEAFESAVAAGMSGPAVHFNIGVAAFRLDQYSRAETAFKKVARTPAMAALAHYNLGLVALRRGNSDDAARWFLLAEQEAGDERLRDLASARLAELPPPPERNWLGYSAFGAGYDDNVALVSNSDVLGISGTEDSFAELQLALSAPLARPWRLDAGLALVDYQELDSFDQLGVHGGGYYRLGEGDWTNEVGLQLAYTTLDGEGFENRRTLSLQTSSEFRPDWRLRARYRFNDIDGLNDFRGLSGHRHEARLRTDWTPEPWELGIEYRFDVSDYDDEAMSVTRQQLGLDLQCLLPGEWAILFSATRRHSNYDVATNGSEDRTEFALAITKTLTTRWQIFLRHAYVDNDADFTEFRYSGNRISAGVEAML